MIDHRTAFPIITLTLVSVATAGLSACHRSNAAPPPRRILISAASDLQSAFAEIGQAFERRTGCRTDFNFGSSGLLARQIAAGVSVDVFASANREYVAELKRQGLIEEGTDRPYARGRISIWTRADSPLNVRTVAELARADITRIAIANPAHAPYGLAAREALIAAGIWDRIQPKLVIGENIRDTLRYAETGSVDVAIVALSLAIPSHGKYTLIPESAHTPIIQELAVIRGSARRDDARAFARFVASNDAARILERFGFERP